MKAVKIIAAVIAMLLLIKLMYPLAIGAACAYVGWHLYKSKKK